MADVTGQAFAFGAPLSFVTVGDTGTVVPSEALLYIFQLAHQQPPTAQSLKKLVPYTCIGLETGPDPIVVCSIRATCRLFRQVVDSCVDLRSSVMVALPLRHSSRHHASGPYSLDKIWWPLHVTRFVARLPPERLVDVRLCIHAGIESLSRPRKLEMLEIIEPLLLRTKSLSIHCGDGRPHISKKTRFCSITRPLPLLQYLEIDNAKFAVGNCGIRPLMAVLQLVSSIKRLVLRCNSIAPPRTHRRVVPVTMPNLKEVRVLGNYDFLPTLISLIDSSSPISFYVYDHNDASAENPWPVPTIPPTLLIERFTMDEIWRPELRTLLPILVHSQELHFIKTSFLQGHWDLLSAADFPLTTELKLERCEFWADGLESLYDHVPTAKTSGTTFASLNIGGSTVKIAGPNIDDFLFWIDRRVAHVDSLRFERKCPIRIFSEEA